MKKRRSYTTTLSPNGQITLPIEWRRKRNIKPGDAFVVSAEHGDIVILPRRGESYKGTKTAI